MRRVATYEEGEELPPTTTLVLVLAPVAGLFAFAAFVVPRRLAPSFSALAVASVPLGALLVANLSALPSLLRTSQAVSLSADLLQDKLVGILTLGIPPAAAAWAILWFAPAACPCPRLPLRPLARASRGAAVALIVVAALALAGALASRLVDRPTPFEAGTWSSVTPWMLIGLSLSAAVAEELLFRGVLYASLVSFTGFFAGGVIQAVIFGLIHVGYGDILYVLAAAVFGLVQAYVAVRWGLLVAIMVHAQVNLAILGWSSRGVSDANGVLVIGALLLNALLLVPLAVACVVTDRASCPIGANALRLPGRSRARRNAPAPGSPRT